MQIGACEIETAGDEIVSCNCSDKMALINPQTHVGGEEGSLYNQSR